MLDPSLLEQYQRLTQMAAFVPLGRRTLVIVSGRDRVQLINNFCTADLQSLTAGQLTEAFVLNPKGKILAHVFVFCFPDQLWLSGVDGQSESLIAHLHKYIIREDVQLLDASDNYSNLFVCGPQANNLLAEPLGAGINDNEHHEIKFQDMAWSAAKVEIAGPGLLYTVGSRQLPQVKKVLEQRGIHPASLEALHSVRLEYGTPWYGLDISQDNFPQELGRDAKAISFSKGCYLGQETVARIDALGHVNRRLVGLQISDPPPTVGTQIMHGEKGVGKLTSVGFSPQLQSAIGLGLVRREFSQPPKKLVVGQSPARIIALPIDSQR